MSSILKTLGALIVLLNAAEAIAATHSVNSTSNDATILGTLPYWLINASDGDIIDCNVIAGQSINLNASLPAITKSYTIDGAGITIDGAGNYQAFQIASGTVVINNVKIQNALSKGGDGGDGYSGGGGAVGGGGALYVHGDTLVTLSASTLRNNIAKGGNGGAANNIGNAGAGGGGGFGGGNGGSALTLVATGGGGGGHSNGGAGGSNLSVNGSNGTYFGGAGGGAGINSVAPGGSGGNTGAFFGGSESAGNGGGGAGDSENGFSATGSGSNGIPGNGGNGIGTDLLFGGGGGGGCSSETGFPGGVGLGAAGGGGGANYSGGAGGILGGGGGGGLGGIGGVGGFGSGGGGATTGGTGGGGFNAGGGNGASDPNGIGAGGGGSGLGGGIFIQSGGSLTIVDAKQIANNSVVAGIGGSSTNASDPSYIPPGDGAAMGNDIFLREQGTIIFNLSNTLTLATPIEGDQTSGPSNSGGLQKNGIGTLALSGTNTYTGMTIVNGGTLNLNGSVANNALISPLGKLSGNATIAGNLTNTGTVHIDIQGNAASLVTVGATAFLGGTLEIALDPNAELGTYTILQASNINNRFNNVLFTGTPPKRYSITYYPTHVDFLLNSSRVEGKGAIGGISFIVKAYYNAQNQIVAGMFYHDPGVGLHFDNPVVTSLIFNGKQVRLGGTVRVYNRVVAFSATLTGGNPGSLSLNLSNGYSINANLTSGGILVQ